jgi:hypothetical protein
VYPGVEVERVGQRAGDNREFALAVALAAALIQLFAIVPEAGAISVETSNGCQTTQDDPCVRSGSCEIQGATWTQDVTVDRSDIFDTQGWPGVCDMVHVGLVQGDCEPPGAQTNVTVHLSATSFASIPSIVGPLSCAGDPAPAMLSFDDPNSHGNVELGSFADVTYTVSNGGQFEATNVVFSGLAGDWSSVGGTCGGSLPAGTSCTIIIRFTPSSVGESADTLVLDYDDGTGTAPTVSKGVAGTGVQLTVPALRGPVLWLAFAGLAATALVFLRHRGRAPGSI